MNFSSLSLPESVAIALFVPSAILCYRKAPSIAVALFASFWANIVYATGIASGESIRWVSALVGFVGAYEFGRGVERMKHRKPVSIPDALRKVDGGTWIGLGALASMGIDGVGLILYRTFDVWVVPEMTIGILVLMGLVGAIGRAEGA